MTTGGADGLTGRIVVGSHFDGSGRASAAVRHLKIAVVRFYCAECAEREFGERV
jgi:hypothetical protein